MATLVPCLVDPKPILIGVESSPHPIPHLVLGGQIEESTVYFRERLLKLAESPDIGLEVLLMRCCHPPLNLPDCSQVLVGLLEVDSEHPQSLSNRSHFFVLLYILVTLAQYALTVGFLSIHTEDTPAWPLLKLFFVDYSKLFIDKEGI